MNELHPLLQGTPGPSSMQARAVNDLATTANLLVQLIDRLKSIEPELRGDCEEGSTAHLRYISAGRYRDGCQLDTELRRAQEVARLVASARSPSLPRISYRGVSTPTMKTSCQLIIEVVQGYVSRARLQFACGLTFSDSQGDFDGHPSDGLGENLTGTESDHTGEHQRAHTL